ncbi:MAG: hypothetical protein IPI91_10085 [Flavobacteriales bacterium]|nr:hypothetical protein [Flavobacteriales bacterium]
MTTKWHIAILCSFILAACSGQEHAEQDLELSLVDDMPIALENNSMQNMHLTKMLGSNGIYYEVHHLLRNDQAGSCTPLCAARRC